MRDRSPGKERVSPQAEAAGLGAQGEEVNIPRCRDKLARTVTARSVETAQRLEAASLPGTAHPAAGDVRGRSLLGKAGP